MNKRKNLGSGQRSATRRPLGGVVVVWLATVLASGPLAATEKLLTTGADWGVPGAWSPVGLPGSTDNVVFDRNGPTLSVSIDGSTLPAIEVQDIANIKTGIVLQAVAQPVVLTLNGGRGALVPLLSTDNKILTLQNGSSMLTLQLAASGTINTGTGGINILCNIVEIGGARSLTKTGSDPLRLAGTNSFSGGLTISTGPVVGSGLASVVIENNSALGTGAVTLSNTASMAALSLAAANLNIANSITLSLAAVTTEILAADGSTSTLSGVISGGGPLTRLQLSTTTVTGNGVIALANTANTFLATIDVVRGTLAIGGVGALGQITNQLRLLQNSLAGGLRFDADNIAVANPVEFVNPARLDANGKTGASIGGNITGATGNRAIPYEVTGGTLTLSGSNTFFHPLSITNATTLVAASPSALGTGTSTTAGVNTDGTTVTDGGTLLLQNVAYVQTEALSLRGTGVSGGGALRGTGISSFPGPIDLATTSRISAPTALDELVLSGVLSGGPTAAFRKGGLGTVTLSGANTYSGQTIVEAGTLRVTGSIANSPNIDVQAGATFDVTGVAGGFTLGLTQTLQGSGTVRGNVLVDGNVAPGASPGVLTFANDLTFGAGSNLTLEINGLAASTGYDQVAVAGVLTLDGTIFVIGTHPFQPGDLFDLLNWGLLQSGSFNLATDLILPALDPALTWDTSNFLVDGSLAVVPEPGAALLFALGLPVVWRRRAARPRA